MKRTSMRALIGAGLLALLLAGCSDEEAADHSGSAQDGQTGQGQDTHTQSNDFQAEGGDHSDIGFQMNDQGEVAEAEGIPAEDEEAILTVFEQYIETFNKEDIEAYLDLLLFDEDHFNEEEEREIVEKTFDVYDVERVVELQTINEYEEDQAQVYSDLVLTTKDPDSGAEATQSGRQITVLNKVEGEWKIASVHFMANPQ